MAEPGHKAAVIIPPSLKHRQTFILLHGRGSNARDFGPALLYLHLGEPENLMSAFPHAKFILPTARARPAAILDGRPINQWYDCWSLEDPSQKEDLQVEGLRETTADIHKMLETEIALVGAKNVVLGGLSQGCASALIALLTWDGEPLGAAVGMCGWLPFRDRLDAIHGDTPKNGDAKVDLVLPAVSFLRTKLDKPGPAFPLAFQATPLFLGHGVEDAKIPLHLGLEMSACLSSVGMEVSWKQYDELGHWFSKDMLLDMIVFLQKALPNGKKE
ncbi:MAG: hypothetical protein M1829_005817 [Trizodia sp. TS-e1964]|nr:MAG: hypothetical protein M1829_005817 [Trizodia sp. TS-e1964]